MKTTQSIKQSAVPFVGAMRMHVALNVNDLRKSTAFYQAVFNTEPTKQKPGYAKFEVAQPSVNFTLNHKKEPIAKKGGLSHLGIQLQDTGQLDAVTHRMREKGLIRLEENNTNCCYALQDKIWVEDPDGNSLEFFVVLDPDTNDLEDPALKGTCCATGVTAT